MQNGNFVAEQPSVIRSNVISQTASDQTREMVHIARTGFHRNIDTPGYYVGGKTGTSQTLVNGRYVNNETIATYLGFGGAINQPSKYVIMIEISSPGMNLEGSLHAMPIFTDISNWMLGYMQIQPKG